MRGGHNFLCRNRAQREPASRQGRRRRRRGPLAIAKYGSLFCDRFERGCCHHPISPPPSHKIHVQGSVCERCVPAQALRASYGENSLLRKSSECIFLLGLGWAIEITFGVSRLMSEPKVRRCTSLLANFAWRGP